MNSGPWVLLFVIIEYPQYPTTEHLATVYITEPTV